MYADRKELNVKTMILTDGKRTLTVNDRAFLIENDLSNSLLHLLGPNRVCSNCRACKTCSMDRQFISSSELQEQVLYQEQMEYDPVHKRILTDFLFFDKSKHGSVLGEHGDHSNISLQRNQRMEMQVLKAFDEPTINNFNKEMANRFLGKEFLTYDQCRDKYGRDFDDLVKYFSPINYARREKQDHSIRPIFDTSVQNSKTKLCFNSFLMCGPSLNTSLIHSWFTVRNFKFLGISDLNKFFNSISYMWNNLNCSS